MYLKVTAVMIATYIFGKGTHILVLLDFERCAVFSKDFWDSCVDTVKSSCQGSGLIDKLNMR